MQKALAPETSTWPEEGFQLIGSRCGHCGETVFPVQPLCPNCSHGEMVDVLLPRRGRVVAFTTQGFVPSFPYIGRETMQDWVPFGVGLVQLGDVVRVEGRLTVSDPAEIEPGMEVELTMVPVTTDGSGDELLIFAFEPVWSTMREEAT
jgi:uncharacterized OB-fold protein